MPMTEKTERNKELIRRREKDPERWSFAALGEFYGIGKITAYDIYRREKQRAGKR